MINIHYDSNNFLFYKCYKLLRTNNPFILIWKILRNSYYRKLYTNDRVKKKWRSESQKKNIYRFDYFISYLETGLFGNLKKTITIFQSLCDYNKNDIISEADDLLAYRFIIYKSKPVFYSNFDRLWNSDPINNSFFQNKNSETNLKPNDNKGFDIKNIWEISRFNFLDILTKAFIITKDDKYSKFAIFLLNDWIEKNPFLEGLNWRMPMEASIRVLNWCFYLPFFNYFKPLEKDSLKKIFNSISQHFCYVENSLEYSFFKENNHYFSNIVCLLLRDCIFSSKNSKNRHPRFAYKEFKKQVQLQFDESGFNFEGSLPYHFFCTEMCLTGLLLLEAQNICVPKEIKFKVKKLIELNLISNSLSKKKPLIGDNDSGTFIPVLSLEKRSGLFFQDFLYKKLSKVHDGSLSLQNIYLDLEKYNEGSLSFDTLNCRQDDYPLFKNYSGLIIAKKNNNGFYFNNNISSQGHTHNDKLSFYPVIENLLLFIDKGSFSYTCNRESRKIDRSSLSHNSMVINSWEQNRFWNCDPFYIYDDCDCDIKTEFYSNILSAKGSHNGYNRYCKGMKVIRQIKWNFTERNYVVKDWFYYKKEREIFDVSWNFLINPKWTVKQIQKGFIFTHNNKTVVLKNCSNITLMLRKCNFSQNYQTINDCFSIKGATSSKSNNIFTFKIYY